MSRNQDIIYIMGLTNSGKTTFIDKMIEVNPDIGAVQVGREFRRRYGPEYFKGQGAPDHTEQEALDIYYELLGKCIDDGKKIILVDGQPRRVSQVKICDPKGMYVFFYCDLETLTARIRRRDSDPEAIKLSEARLITDAETLKEVIWAVIQSGRSFMRTTPEDLATMMGRRLTIL